mmetsp:Transcript_36721/g.97314  ORF Transcript_36721/g.97314 Transcript_36721/m.97314 type:complete len:269 (+) Transcript_36721:275-1081(+)
MRCCGSAERYAPARSLRIPVERSRLRLGVVADVYAFNLRSLAWSVVAASGAAPPARSFPNVATMKGRHYVYGGITTAAYLYNGGDPDVYELDLAASQWTRYPARPIAPVRVLSAFAAHEPSLRLFLFGGATSLTSLTQDFNVGLHDDLFQFSLATREWTRLNATGSQPLKRLAGLGILAHGLRENVSQLRDQAPWLSFCFHAVGKNSSIFICCVSFDPREDHILFCSFFVSSFSTSMGCSANLIYLFGGINPVGIAARCACKMHGPHT